MRYFQFLICCIVMSVSNAAFAHLILAYGDSLTAPYGMHPKQSWVFLIQEQIQKRNFPFKVINGGISGATTHTALAQFDKALAVHQPKVILIGLGSNDGRLGLSTQLIKENLQEMIHTAQKKNILVLLIGFKLPVNYGSSYRNAFEQVFHQVAEEMQVPLVPFLLEGIALKKEYTLEDGLHPNVSAQPKIFQNVWPHLEPILIELMATEKGKPPRKGTIQRIFEDKD